MTIERGVKPIRALARGLEILGEIERRRGASLHDLHGASGLPKATLLRILLTLAQQRMIWQRLADKAYLARASGRSDAAIDLGDRLAEIASPELAALGRRVAWPSVIAVARADHVEIVETNGPMARLDAVTLGPVGTKLSYIHTAVGRACLAAFDPAERAAIIARLRPDDASPASRAQLDMILVEIAERGWSSRDPPHPWPDRSRGAVRRDGRRSIAVAVRVAGRAVAAINLTWPRHRSATAEIVERHLPALVRAAALIGARAEAAQTG